MSRLPINSSPNFFWDIRLSHTTCLVRLILSCVWQTIVRDRVYLVRIFKSFITHDLSSASYLSMWLASYCTKQSLPSTHFWVTTVSSLINQKKKKCQLSMIDIKMIHLGGALRCLTCKYLNLTATFVVAPMIQVLVSSII